MTFVVAEDSKLLKDGAAVTLEDLKQGDKVTVTTRPVERQERRRQHRVESKT
jgi:hypothetical protein